MFDHFTGMIHMADSGCYGDWGGTPAFRYYTWQGTQYLGWSGHDECMFWKRGIHKFVYAFRHENTHRAMWADGRAVYLPSPDDNDSDRVHDFYENLMHLDPDTSDSTGAYPWFAATSPNFYHKDFEVCADVAALGQIPSSLGLWTQDWANDGLQKGPRDFARFPWVYGAWIADPVSGDHLTPNNPIYPCTTQPCHTDHVTSLP